MKSPILSLILFLTVTLALRVHADDVRSYSTDEYPQTLHTDWMKWVPDSTNLTEMSLPGTHDTMSLYGGPIPETQTMSLRSQLNAGIRVLDIRCRHIEDRFTIHHGPIFQNAYFGEDVLKVCYDFLQDNPSETILLRVGNDHMPEAEGSGQPVRLLQHVHCLPLLMPYSCSSIAAWGEATEDGHLYQTRNLDWALRAGAHEFPVIIVYLPNEGHAHVTPSFAGFIGAHCGMNDAGVVLSEIGDASAKERPYNLHAPHFTSWFRALLYDADSLTETLSIFRRVPPTKSYHFVFGDGRTERKAVKIRAASSGDRPQSKIDVWSDNDAADELAPKILSCIVYHDEGRGAFPTLDSQRGKLNGEKLIALANQIPIKGGNVMNAVFDATALRVWVSYAGAGKEAYQRPYAFLDLATLDADADGQPDLSGHHQ